MDNVSRPSAICKRELGSQVALIDVGGNKALANLLDSKRAEQRLLTLSTGLLRLMDKFNDNALKHFGKVNSTVPCGPWSE